MKILLVSDNYPPFLGGAHRQTQLLGRELVRRGHTVKVATLWHGGMPSEEEDEGVTVYRLKQMRTWLPGLVRSKAQQYQPPWPDPVTTWQLRQVINQFEPDVIHAYGWISYSLAVALIGKSIPVLLSGRDYAYGCANRSLLWHGQTCTGPALAKCLECASTTYGGPKGWAAVWGVFLHKPLLRRKVNGLHSVSTYVQHVTRRDFLDDRLSSGQRRIGHTVIPSFQESAPESTTLGLVNVEPYVKQLPATTFILFVGALRLVKGLEPLIAAYVQLNNPPPLVLVGTVESDTPKFFPPGVQVLQNFPHAAVMAAWEHCLFGVLPSLWPEPLGSVVYEGMSKGKAVIGTTPGGHTDIIVDGETGFLVPAGNVEALRVAMQTLLDDGALRQQFGQAGRQRAKLFTADVAVPRFEQIYRQLTAARAGRPLEPHSIPLGEP